MSGTQGSRSLRVRSFPIWQHLISWLSYILLPDVYGNTGNLGLEILYSFVLNSAVFLIAVFCCYWFRNSSKAVAFTAGSTFALSLYLGYGMKLGFPVAFLPTFQVREAISSQAFILPGALIIGAAWIIVLIALAWNKFCKCDLK